MALSAVGQHSVLLCFGVQDVTVLLSSLFNLTGVLKHDTDKPVVATASLLASHTVKRKTRFPVKVYDILLRLA